MLVEMNKLEAPSMLLEDFNYIINKAIYQYINKRYNIYDVNQQTTDDLRVLKSTAVLTPNEGANAYGENDPLYGKIAEFNLPLDYMHMLNCLCNFKVAENFKCYNEGDNVQFAARRLTSDAWSQVLNNFYLRPMYKRPYYFIHNVNTNTELPTNPSNWWVSGTDQGHNITLKKGIVLHTSEQAINELGLQETYTISDIYGGEQIDFPVITLQSGEPKIAQVDPETGNIIGITGSESEAVGRSFMKFGETITIVQELPKTITIGKQSVSLVEKPGMNRYGNASPVRMEIRYGKDSSIFTLDRIYIDYIKTPQHIRLTQEQLDTTRDTSQIMEFPDYVCQEIINELVKLMMENASDPRLQTHIPINQTIANPAQAQQSK